MATEGKAIDAQGAVSFVVSFNESPPKQRKLPKGLTARRQQQKAKASLTGESIAEKQKRAEERRQKLKEEKIERIHQLEEDMAGLARKIQAHEEARKSAIPLPPPSSSLITRTDKHSQGHGTHTSNHVMNGIIHSTK